MTCPEPRSGAAVGSFQSRGLFGPFALSLRSTAESRATCRPASPPSSRGCRGGQRTECVWTPGALSCPSRLVHTQGPHVWLSRLVLMLLRVMTTATHRAGGLASDDMAGGREGAERLLSLARGRQEAELHRDLGANPHEPGPPRPCSLGSPVPSPLPLARPRPGGLRRSGWCAAPLQGPADLRGDREGARLPGRRGPGAEPHMTRTLRETPGVQPSRPGLRAL